MSVPSFPQAHSLQASAGETVGAWPHGASRTEAEAPRQLWGPRWPGAVCAGSGHLRGGFSTLLSASDHCAPLTCEHITAQCLDSHCQAGHRGVECSKTLPFPPLSGALSSKCDRPGAENGWDVGWGGAAQASLWGRAEWGP